MAKCNDIRALADIHAREISRSPRDWTGYLDTAARLYRKKRENTLEFDFKKCSLLLCAKILSDTLAIHPASNRFKFRCDFVVNLLSASVSSAGKP